MNKKPEVTIKENGARIVAPYFGLKEKIGGASITSIVTDRAVENAEQAIENHGSSYAQEVMDEIIEIKDQINNLAEKIESGDVSKDRDEFRLIVRNVLNIKSNAGLYGYSLATQVARSLFEYCMESDCMNARGITIINVHIDALSAVFERNIQGEGGEIGKAIQMDLSALTGIKLL